MRPYPIPLLIKESIIVVSSSLHSHPDPDPDPRAIRGEHVHVYHPLFSVFVMLVSSRQSPQPPCALTF